MRRKSGPAGAGTHVCGGPPEAPPSGDCFRLTQIGTEWNAGTGTTG